MLINLPSISMIRPGASQEETTNYSIWCNNALTISPDLEMPPSAIIETSFLGRNRRCVQCGHLRIPTPATILVVQIEPGP